MKPHSIGYRLTISSSNLICKHCVSDEMNNESEELEPTRWYRSQRGFPARSAPQITERDRAPIPPGRLVAIRTYVPSDPRPPTGPTGRRRRLPGSSRRRLQLRRTDALSPPESSSAVTGGALPSQKLRPRTSRPGAWFRRRRRRGRSRQKLPSPPPRN